MKRMTLILALFVIFAGTAHAGPLRERVRERRSERGGFINAVRVLWWVVHPFGHGFPRPGPVR